MAYRTALPPRTREIPLQSPRRRRRRPALPPHGRDHETLHPAHPLRRPRLSARPLRRPPPANRLPLHVQPGARRRLLQLLRRRRQHRASRAPALARHDAGARVAGAGGEDRGVQAADGLGGAVVLVVRDGV